MASASLSLCPVLRKQWSPTRGGESRLRKITQTTKNSVFRRLAYGFLSVVCLGAPSLAQTYTQRGFLENRATFYPQKALNDSGTAIGESLLRYEGFYLPSTQLQFAGAVDFRIDTHHQVDRDFHLSWLDRGIQRPAVAIRRLSATFHRGPVTLELGKQFVRWGKTDIVTPIDRFAPRDFLTVVDNDFLAVTAARLNYEKGSNTVEAVWSPSLTPSRIPLENQRWAPPLQQLPTPVTVRDVQTVFPGGSQTGIRWNHTGTLEYELSLYQGFNHLPSFEAALSQSETGLTLEVERFYPKMLMAGGNVAIPSRWFTLKSEAAYFGSSDARADEYVLYVIQLERQSGEWSFIGGYAGEAVTQRGSSTADFAPDRGLTKTILGRANYTIDTNRSVAFEAAVRQNGDGLWVKSEYSQALGRHWRATLNLTLIRGELNDFLGQYRRNSHAIVVVRYSF